MAIRIQRSSAAARARLPHKIAIVLALAALGVSACSDSPSEPEEVDVTGTYALASVGGNRLPASIYEGPMPAGGQTIQVRVDVPGGSLRLDAERYELRVQMTLHAQGQTAPASLLDRGSYEQVGDRIEFTSDDADVGAFRGTLSSGTIGLVMNLIGEADPPLYQFRK